jgi:1-deoxy-D-xylulose-5-phosphate reductoisomerase
MQTFPCLQIAMDAMSIGGNTPCIMNAANEIAVQAFLQKKIGFNQIPEVIQTTIAKVPFHSNPVFADYVETDQESRTVAAEICG